MLSLGEQKLGNGTCFAVDAGASLRLDTKVKSVMSRDEVLKVKKAWLPNYFGQKITFPNLFISSHHLCLSFVWAPYISRCTAQHAYLFKFMYKSPLLSCAPPLLLLLSWAFLENLFLAANATICAAGVWLTPLCHSTARCTYILQTYSTQLLWLLLN